MFFSCRSDVTCSSSELIYRSLSVACASDAVIHLGLKYHSEVQFSVFYIKPLAWQTHKPGKQPLKHRRWLYLQATVKDGSYYTGFKTNLCAQAFVAQSTAFPKSLLLIGTYRIKYYASKHTHTHTQWIWNAQLIVSWGAEVLLSPDIMRANHSAIKMRYFSTK